MPLYFLFFQELYKILMRQILQTWQEMEAQLEDLPKVINVTKAQLEQALSQPDLSKLESVSNKEWFKIRSTSVFFFKILHEDEKLYSAQIELGNGVEKIWGWFFIFWLHNRGLLASKVLKSYTLTFLFMQIVSCKPLMITYLF